MTDPPPPKTYTLFHVYRLYIYLKLSDSYCIYNTRYEMCTPCFVVTCAAAEEIFKSKMNVHFQNSNIRNMEFVWFTKPRQKCHALSKYNEAGHGSIFHSQVFSGFVSSLNHDIYNCKWVQHKSKIFNANFTISLQMQVQIFFTNFF